MIMEEVADILENTITILKLSLDMDFNLCWFNKKDDQNFCVGICGNDGITCNAVIVHYLKGERLLYINLYKPGAEQHSKHSVLNTEDINIMINNYLQDIINTLKYLNNM